MAFRQCQHGGGESPSAVMYPLLNKRHFGGPSNIFSGESVHLELVLVVEGCRGHLCHC